MKSLCEHAIQSRFEAARLYGVTKLQQLVDQVRMPAFWERFSDFASDYGAFNISKFDGTGRHSICKP